MPAGKTFTPFPDGMPTSRKDACSRPSSASWQRAEATARKRSAAPTQPSGLSDSPSRISPCPCLQQLLGREYASALHVTSPAWLEAISSSSRLRFCRRARATCAAPSSPSPAWSRCRAARPLPRLRQAAMARPKARPPRDPRRFHERSNIRRLEPGTSSSDSASVLAHVSSAWDTSRYTIPCPPARAADSSFIPLSPSGLPLRISCCRPCLPSSPPRTAGPSNCMLLALSWLSLRSSDTRYGAAFTAAASSSQLSSLREFFERVSSVSMGTCRASSATASSCRHELRAALSFMVCPSSSLS
mmetsp:Transcript_5499/g.15311  ORF Transcript_5499/g.15311 Transcript_5499/m.15311 type:complete len:301 (+) Transcript_5499:2036-2938(+)